VIKNPIDLSTIRNKLKNGDYTDAWQYINDIQLMFDNAWLYNRKTSKVYKYCSKVSVLVYLFCFSFCRFQRYIQFCLVTENLFLVYLIIIVRYDYFIVTMVNTGMGDHLDPVNGASCGASWRTGVTFRWQELLCHCMQKASTVHACPGLDVGRHSHRVLALIILLLVGHGAKTNN
jgi:Bromodomain